MPIYNNKFNNLKHKKLKEEEILEKLNKHLSEYKTEQDELEIKISYRPFNQVLLEERLTIVMFIVKELGNYG